MMFSKISPTTFKDIQTGAGILVDEFDPATKKFGHILGSTSGGINVKDAITTSDLGDDIDNCPKNMKELMQLDGHNVTASCSFATMSEELAVMAAAASDIDPEDPSHIILRNDFEDRDFKNIWWLGDYGDVNTGDDAGFIAIHLMNAINTGGFSIQTQDRQKGKFDVTFTACYSMDDPDRVPFELFVRHGGAEPEPITITMTPDTLSLNTDDHDSDTVTVSYNADVEDVKWASSADEYATVSGTGKTATVTAVDTGEADITATIEVDGQTYTATCKVTVGGA